MLFSTDLRHRVQCRQLQSLARKAQLPTYQVSFPAGNNTTPHYRLAKAILARNSTAMGLWTETEDATNHLLNLHHAIALSSPPPRRRAVLIAPAFVIFLGFPTAISSQTVDTAPDRHTLHLSLHNHMHARGF